MSGLSNTTSNTKKQSMSDVSDEEVSAAHGVLAMRHSTGNTSATLATSKTSGKRPPLESVAVVLRGEDKENESETVEGTKYSSAALSAIVKNVITREVFSRIKFVQNFELDYSFDESCLAQRIGKICNIHVSDREEWWQAARSLVKKGIAITRAQKAGQLRVAFMSK
jgi:hypothetical protein